MEDRKEVKRQDYDTRLYILQEHGKFNGLLKE